MLLFLIICDVLYMGMFMPYMLSLKSNMTPILGLLTIPLVLFINTKLVKSIVKSISQINKEKV